jgi:multidrug resistance efflux pump
MDDSNKRRMTRSRGFWRVIATLVITAVGIFAGIQLWQRYMLTPWTRDGRVLANSVTIASEVSGRIVDIRVRENQSVKKGDILFISDSFRVEAYLEETKLNFVKVGDSATVILMSGAPAIKGRVDSIARAIGDTENPVGQNLLQNVNATFEWVRLAQRIPVRIKLVDVPNETILSSGMTTTVRIEPRHESEKEAHLAVQ